HLAKVEVASSSLVTRSTVKSVETIWFQRFLLLAKHRPFWDAALMQLPTIDHSPCAYSHKEGEFEGQLFESMRFIQPLFDLPLTNKLHKNRPIF
ncbi:hypothetical protein, partial [Anaerotruncus sp.]|uniref:hypothetical protein n=1 Tax=Anaerotruncus sp. TaxID=1872531 RepID=UPI0025BA99F0